jgi:hypothetical protein
MHPGERGICPQCIQDMGDFAGVDFNASATSLQFSIQDDQRFTNKAKMLKRCVRLVPHAGFDDVDAPNLSQSTGLREGGMVMPAEVSLEPNQLVTHRD